MYWGSLTFYFTSVQTANQYKGPLAVCEEDIDQKKIYRVFQIMACPGCRKPLPRCALCLVHMGTSSSLSQKPANQGQEN